MCSKVGHQELVKLNRPKPEQILCPVHLYGLLARLPTCYLFFRVSEERHTFGAETKG